MNDDTPNKTQVNPSQLLKALAFAEKANLVPFIMGPPGVGKSAIVKQYAGSRQFCDIRLNNHTPVDMMGFPYIDKETNRMRFSIPALLPSRPNAVQFYDEFTTGPKQSQNVCLQITHDKRIGEWEAPEGTFTVLASNSSLDRCHVERVSSALANRVVWLYLRPDLEDTTNYMLDRGLDVRTVAFLRFRPDLLHSFEAKHWDGESGFASPRSWEAAARLTAQEPPAGLREPLFEGVVGRGPGIEYVTFLALYEKLPGFDRIIKDPEGSEVPRDPATLYAVVSAVANRVTEETVAPLLCYLGRLPKEFEVFGVKAMFQSKKAVLSTTPEFIRWAVNNSDLMG